ncbi:F-box domain-containing protein [Mycena kentingensis (nom. inval.)]|nr:F-box domain-containing protein [Mycena kentingensis (nom. inval.)]
MKYEAIRGFFAQDDPLADAAKIGPVPARFGLLDETEGRWENLLNKIKTLNDTAAGASQYKLIIFARHGQGQHNVAQDKYGMDAWVSKWGALNGDGEIVWGPDRDLTSRGETEAAAANAMWTTERRAGIPIPIPEKLYCSPITRAMQTQQITFNGVTSQAAVVLESLRELYGADTCDKRQSKSYIQQRFPHLEIEAGFTEEDELWTTERETVLHATERAYSVLERIFEDDKDSIVISITAHTGIISAFLPVLGRAPYELPTGGVLPIVVKASAA